MPSLSSCPRAAAASGSVLTREVPESVRLFWDQLRSLEVVDHVLRLGEGALFPLPQRGSSALYVRDTYDALIARIAEHILVTGTPGIGKTFFAFYFIHYLVTHGVETVVFWAMQGDIYLHRNLKDGPKTSFMTTEECQLFLQQCPQNTWYIVDAYV
eukprot:m51a1_g3187 hypothetical protein (156) ;mRNA; f:427936-428601